MIFFVMIGGPGTVEGPIIGAALFFALEHALSDQGSWYLIILGLLAIVVMVFMPEGIWGKLEGHTGISPFPPGACSSVDSEPRHHQQTRSPTAQLRRPLGGLA